LRSSGTCLATGDCHSVHEDALFTATLIVKERHAILSGWRWLPHVFEVLVFFEEPLNFRQ
jgi:hypothetical protein